MVYFFFLSNPVTVVGLELSFSGTNSECTLIWYGRSMVSCLVLSRREWMFDLSVTEPSTQQLTEGCIEVPLSTLTCFNSEFYNKMIKSGLLFEDKI